MTKERIAEYDSNNDGLVSMDEYFVYIYGNADNTDLLPTQENRDQILQSQEQDKRRWSYADFNRDGSLSLDELAAFENPEDYEEMKDYNVEETFENLDSDRDGKVSLNEYLGSDVSSSVAAEEVDFRERYFKILKDRNKDGFLDKVEVKKWLHRSFPSRIDIETNGFMQQIDRNKDGSLNQDEILKNWDKFKTFYPDLQNTLLEHDEL
ncbi:calumenin-A-like [Dendronephthya gigantea]|uniref:calumenin-A-like n=1 Tax=Dendronephthya gigantea TaxID=151771 RepID=UPI00106CB409|nr:calumenin-A-like [Dendronephthya gigantea]